MPSRRLPVQPNLSQLKKQAKELLKAAHQGDAEALADFAEFHPDTIEPRDAKLADAQLVLARSYQAASWPRLVQACELIAAIWKDDVKKVRDLLVAHPALIREPALIRGDSNWGPPLDYAANVGRNTIIKVIHALDPEADLGHAIGRAVLQSRIDTAAMLHQMAGLPQPPDDALGGPAYTLSVAGTEFLFSVGARVRFDDGSQHAPVEVVIGSDSRRPDAKRRILQLYEEHGYVYPDTPVMAFHRGRFDLLAQHLARDPALLSRQFPIDEIFPPEVGCRHTPHECMGTPVDGGTLLHLAVYWDEFDTAEWLLAHGADVNARTAVEPDGFGGHTPLFNAVVSQANFWMNHTKGWTQRARDTRFTQLLLDRGADPNARASIRMRFGEGHGDPRIREFRDVSPLSWARQLAASSSAGERYDGRIFVNEAALDLVKAAGGAE